MTEEVLISVKGLHTMEDTQKDEVEVISAGKYYKRNGKHYVLFEETVEGSGESINSRIKLPGSAWRYARKGLLTASWYLNGTGRTRAGTELLMEICWRESG